MNIINISVKDLKPYGKNPRKNDQAVDAVAASIREFGWKVPLVITSDKEIVAGHTRWKAAKKLGLKDVPCIISDDLTPEQIKAFRLADNKTSEYAEWDIPMLENELKDIFEIDMGKWGFEIPEEETEVELERVELAPYRKVHYLISCDINLHDKIVDLINQLREMEGVEIESALN